MDDDDDEVLLVYVSLSSVALRIHEFAIYLFMLQRVRHW